MKASGGSVAPAPHRPENVPRNCWTCIHCEFASDMVNCPHIDRPNHAKIGIDPCDKYELNAIWLMVGWFYPERKAKA